MTINFNKYVKDNHFLCFGKREFEKRCEMELMELNTRKMPERDYQKELAKKTHNYFNKLIKFIENNKNITKLNLSHNNLDNSDIKLLVHAIKNSNITSLDISKNNINVVGLREIAQCSKLVSLDISGNRVGPKCAEAIITLPKLTHLNISHTGLGYKDAAAIITLPKLTHLNVSDNSLGDVAVRAIIALSSKVINSNLTHLDISNNNIGVAEIVAIAKKLPNLTNLKIANNISPYGIETLAALKKVDIETSNYAHSKFLKLLKDNNVMPENIKNMLFDIVARGNNDAIPIIKHIINSPEKYPFAINSRDGNGHSLLHFYNHKPDMLLFLFNHGIIPDQEQQHGRLKTLAQDKQSVHTKEAVALTKFNTSKLVEAYGNIENTQQLLAKAEAYQAGLTKLYQVYQDSIKLKLLSLPDSGKRDTMKKTLAANQPTPNDQDYVDTVIDKAKIALTTKYLAKTNGQYNSVYATCKMEYADGHKITIPQSLGLVKSLIDTMEIPVDDKKELLVTLMKQNPGLVENKLEIIQNELGIDVTVEKLANSTECHKLLENTDLKIIEELFKNISGLDIDQTWREQKEFTLTERIYIAATTYGDNATACLHGVWDYITNSTTEINKEFYNEFTKLQEQESKNEKERISITESNIQEFIGELAKKLIDFVKDKPELQERLAYLGLAMIEVKKPQEITIEQQKILAEINKAFTETIKTYLPNYNRTMPEFEEYDTIIKELVENNALKQFVTNYYAPQQAEYSEDYTSANSLVGALHQPTDEQTVEIIGGVESAAFEL